MAEPCGDLLREFFAERRRQQRAERGVSSAEPIPTGEVIELDPPPANP
jgi:hypothetical protein